MFGLDMICANIYIIQSIKSGVGYISNQDQ